MTNHEKLQELYKRKQILEKIIDSYNNSSGESFSNHPNYLTQPPRTPEFCIGRDKMLETMHQKLMTGKNLLLVNGLGGMGKTTLALQYLAIPKYCSAYQHIAWVSLINQELTDALINSLHRELEIDLQKYPNKVEQLQAIAQNLANLPGNKLLLIDNANDAKELTENEKLLKQLHCKIIITSRGNPDNYTKIDVDELDMDDAKQVFLHYYRIGDLPNLKDLEDLLNHINRHTLMTELLAKAGKKKGLVPSRLLELLQQTDTSHPDLNRNITIGLHADMTNKQKESKLHDYIHSLFEPENETEANKDFLQKFCLFANMDVPLGHLKKIWQIGEKVEKGTTKTKNIIQKLFSSIFPKEMKQKSNLSENDFEDFLDDLVKIGWLSSKNQNYRMHQLLAGVIENKLKPNAQNCKVLIDSLKQILDKEHLSRVAIFYIPYAQVIINKLKENDSSLGLLCIFLSDTFEKLRQFSPALEAIEKAEKIFEAINDKEDLACCCERKVTLYNLLGNHDLALENCKKGVQLFKERYKKNPKNEDSKEILAIFYEKLGDVYFSLGNLDLAIENYKEEIILFEELHEYNPLNESFKRGLAISYSCLGNVYSSLENLDLAFENYLQSNRLAKEFYEQNPENENFKVTLAISYSHIGSVYSSLENLDLALENYLESNGLKKELYDQNPRNERFKENLASSYSDLGNVYSSFENLDLALENYLQSNRLTKELYEQNPEDEGLKEGLAISYSQLGDVYSSLGKLDLALENYEKYNELSAELYGQNPKNESLKEGLAISYSQLGDVYSSLGKLDLALESYEKDIELNRELYEQNPKDESLKHRLAISYQKLGEVYLRMEEPAKSFIQYCEFNLLLDQLYYENPRNVAIASDYAESLAITAAFNLKANESDAAQQKLELAKKIWNELHALSEIKKYEGKLSILSKMLEKDADLDRMIIEMSSF